MRICSTPLAVMGLFVLFVLFTCLPTVSLFIGHVRGSGHSSVIVNECVMAASAIAVAGTQQVIGGNHWFGSVGSVVGGSRLLVDLWAGFFAECNFYYF